MNRRIDPEQDLSLAGNPAAAGCTHAEAVRTVRASGPGCQECLATGGYWVHLRVCMTCGHIGCCDSSPGRHATAHYHETEHPIVRSVEPGETWGWCYVDEAVIQ